MKLLVQLNTALVAPHATQRLWQRRPKLEVTGTVQGTSFMERGGALTWAPPLHAQR
jgi:hypothetical protein